MDCSRDIAARTTGIRARDRAARAANVEKPRCFKLLRRYDAFRRSFVIQPDTVVKPEIPSIEQDKMVSPHAREVEYALILARMINIVKEDPSQMRLAIYQFARARLKIDTSWAEEAEREQLSAALETAIQGVEQFSVREEKERLHLSTPLAQIGLGASPAEAAPTSMLAIRRTNSAPDDIPARKEVYWRAAAPPVLEVQTRPRVSRLARFSIGILLFGAVASLAVSIQRTPIIAGGRESAFNDSIDGPKVGSSAIDSGPSWANLRAC
jgi:hypothetical protein